MRSRNASGWIRDYSADLEERICIFVMHVELVRSSCFNKEHDFDKKWRERTKKKGWGKDKRLGKDTGLGKDTEADSDRFKALCRAILLSPVHRGD
jgi:hypothetical protein